MTMVWALAAPGGLADRAGIQVRVFIERGVDAVALAPLPRVASHLLEGAGVHVSWLDCATDRRCNDRDLAIAGITVSVRHGHAGASHRCATAAFDPAGRGGMVLVDYECVVEAQREIQATPAARSSPLLATLSVGDLVGLAVAHEIGHIARLTHAPTGIMRARLDLADIASFRAGTLAFSGREAKALRLALLMPTQPGGARTGTRIAARQPRPRGIP